MRYFLFLLVATATIWAQDEPRVLVGIKGGTNLNNTYTETYFSRFSRDPQPQDGAFGGAARDKGYLVGPSVEVRLPWRFSVEANALYSRLNYESYSLFRRPDDVTVEAAGANSVNRWDLPFLLKYRLPRVFTIQPFVSSGGSFSFRHHERSDFRQVTYRPEEVTTFQGTNTVANPRLFGKAFIAAAGVEWQTGPVRLAPEFRYVRQERQSLGSASIGRDQVQFLVGISFGRSGD